MAGEPMQQVTAEDIQREIRRRIEVEIQGMQAMIHGHELAIRGLRMRISKLRPEMRPVKKESPKRDKQGTREEKILQALRVSEGPKSASYIRHVTGLKRMAFLITVRALLKSERIYRCGGGRGIVYSLPTV